MGRAFKEQVIWLTRAWDGWSETEKVIALYNVARKLSPIPARFLQTLLAQNIQNDNVDILAAEARANDPAWIGRVSDSDDCGAADILQHLPMLRPTNTEAKALYLTVIPKVLTHVLSQTPAQPLSLERARQILSYSLIHPALSPDDRRSLSGWLRALEDRLCHLRHTQLRSSATYEAEEVDETGRGGGITDKGGGSTHDPSYCSGLEGSTPKITEGGNPQHWTFHASGEDDSSKLHWQQSSSALLGPNDCHQEKTKEDNRWICPEPPLSPNNSGTSSRSSGSESVTEEFQAVSPHLGMRDIGVWLKSLRLHKYSPLLCNLKYEELLSLNEEALEAKGITKGARHKIVLSIAKLKERSKQLDSIEKDLLSGGSIQNALNQLNTMVITPMLPPKITPVKTEELQEGISDAIPSRSSCSKDSSIPHETRDMELSTKFTKVMGKVCTQLLVCVRPDDDAMTSFLGLVEKCLNHEAYVHVQTRLHSWKQQILRIWHPLPPRSRDARHVRRWSQQYSGDLLNNPSFRSSRFTQRYSTPSSSQMAGILAAVGGANSNLHPHRTTPPLYAYQPSLGKLIAPSRAGSFVATPALTAASFLSPQHFLSKRPSLQEPLLELRPHVTLQRTRSAPSRPHQLPILGGQPSRSAVSPPDRQQQILCSRTTSTVASTDNNPSIVAVNNTDLRHPSRVLSTNQDNSNDSDITNRLESLCLSMTEHALG